jgi:membrane-anchored protein YejM (alkaline phosphatase superfamily)
LNYLHLSDATNPLPLLNRYLNSVHYVDGLIGQALTAIEDRGLLDDSIIVVTGDHGQEFNDSGLNYWGHGSNFTRHQTNVPLLVYTPKAAPRIYRHRTTHFDVMPTLLRDHFGCGAPLSSFSVGHPLSQPGGREALLLSEYTDFAIVTTDRIAVVRKQGMQVLDASYTELEDARLDPSVVAAALEQRSRFYRRPKVRSKRPS